MMTPKEQAGEKADGQGESVQGGKGFGGAASWGDSPSLQDCLAREEKKRRGATKIDSLIWRGVAKSSAGASRFPRPGIYFWRRGHREIVTDWVGGVHR